MLTAGFGRKRCLLRTAVMMITVLLAEAIPRFDLIMGLIGGALMGQLMFIYPPLMYRRLRTLYARKFAQMSSLNYKMSYGSNGVLPTNLRALVFSVHRADLSMEDRLESVHLLSRPTSVVQRTRKSTLFDFFQLERALDMGTLDMCEKSVNILLITLGISASVLSTYYSFSEIIEYADFTPPCILNVSLASKLTYKQA